MENFAGRDSELDFLKRQYDRTGSQLIVVYGNKGVGKTRLLQEFCGDREWKCNICIRMGGKQLCREDRQAFQEICGERKNRGN